jgi:ribosomal protein S18 acetylase RimI-like enzyme
VTGIRFRNGGVELLDAIEPLWRALCEHHATINPDFAAFFRQRPFAARKRAMLDRRPAALLVRLALADESAVGYCVAALGTDGIGEIDSIYVASAHRSRGLGESLLRHALRWLDAQGAASVTVAVVPGNDRALAWYGRFGFAPRLTTLTRPADRAGP